MKVLCKRQTFQKMCVFVIVHWLDPSSELLDACIRNRTLVISGFRTLKKIKIKMCVCACVRACVRACVSACVCVCDRTLVIHGFRTFRKIHLSAIAHWLYPASVAA